MHMLSFESFSQNPADLFLSNSPLVSNLDSWH